VPTYLVTHRPRFVIHTPNSNTIYTVVNLSSSELNARYRQVNTAKGVMAANGVSGRGIQETENGIETHKGTVMTRHSYGRLHPRSLRPVRKLRSQWTDHEHRDYTPDILRVWTGTLSGTVDTHEGIGTEIRRTWN